MKKVALYSRVSTSSQHNENQVNRLIQYALNNNLQFDLFEEKESTRKTRPVKQEMLNRARKGDYTAIIVFKLDRYARSSRELIIEIKELTDKGIDFISISDNLDFTTASGKLHFQILAAFAEFERSLISERTKEGLRRSKEQGTKLGRPKGAKDKKKRQNGGYLLREMNKRNKIYPITNNTPLNNSTL
jgi:DNA invertase Pin-like site-specific DNA recombinase